MKKLLAGVTLAVMVTFAGSVASRAQSESRSAALGDWGFEASGVDSRAVPGDSFYDYANGTWDAQTPIPPDRARYGVFDALRERAQEQLRAIIEDNAKSGAARDTEAGKIG